MNQTKEGWKPMPWEQGLPEGSAIVGGKAYSIEYEGLVFFGELDQFYPAGGPYPRYRYDMAIYVLPNGVQGIITIYSNDGTSFQRFHGQTPVKVKEIDRSETEGMILSYHSRKSIGK